MKANRIYGRYITVWNLINSSVSKTWHSLETSVKASVELKTVERVIKIKKEKAQCEIHKE